MINKDDLYKIVDEIYNLPNTIEYCPLCDNEIKYIANPYYIHVCMHCNREYSKYRIKTVFKKDIAVDLLYDFIQRIKDNR